MSSLAVTAVVSSFLVVVMLFWRAWPFLRGRASPSDDLPQRLLKWNRYLLKLMRKTLREQVAVAQVGFFKDQKGTEHTMATWAMLPTVIPDVEYIALARPGEARPVVEAVARAAELRELLADGVRDQSLWGHEAWLYTWPEDTDLDAVVKRLTPIAKFREKFGLAAEA